MIQGYTLAMFPKVVQYILCTTREETGKRTLQYRREECIIPQLDGTYNVSNSSNADLPDYLDLANTNIIQYKTRGQKQRQKTAETELANRHLVNIESIMPNTRTRKQRQKVQDDEEIDMDKIAKDDTPRYVIKRDLKTYCMLEK